MPRSCLSARWSLHAMPRPIGGTCPGWPRLATQAQSLAAKLKELQAWPTAVAFYQQAIEIPLTEEEVAKMGRLRQVSVPPDDLRAFFAIQAREEMAECLLAMDRNDEAQKWMVEAADLRAQHKLGLNAILAGQVQGASGQTVIEGRIQEEQALKEDDPKYWQERAGYYRGRNEPGLEEEALQKALARTVPQPPPERPSKGYTDLRRWILSDYAHFLQRRNRIPEAVALLHRELEQSPADAVSTEGAAYVLAFDFPTYLDAKDETLWTWLAGRPKWGFVEERLLWRMLENAPREALDGFFARAEGLAREQDPSRALTLGWIVNRMGFAKRSMPLLEYAAQHAPNADLREKATFTLFESCLDIGDWKRGEELFPQAAARLTLAEAPEWCSRLAVLAARAGAKADAMRLWRTATSTDLTQLGGLSDLARTGLRDELTGFYTEMARKIPSSEVPGRAIKILRSSGSELPPVEAPPLREP
jgi:tetratricopeptide (TPR) repeat protein